MPVGLIKWFSSADFGAPTLSGTAGALVALLDTVLLNGYGSRSIAGGTAAAGLATYTVGTLHGYRPGQVLLFAGANEAAYNGEKKVLATGPNWVACAIDPAAPASSTGAMTAKMAPLGWNKVLGDAVTGCYASANPDSPKHVLRVDDTGTVVSPRSAGVRGYESMQDTFTGAGPFPTPSQASNAQMLWLKSNNTDATARQWYIIGDDRCFYYFVAVHTSFFNQFQGTFFGDLAGTDPFSTTLHAFITENYSVTNGLPECISYNTGAAAVSAYHPRSAGGYGASTQAYKVYGASNGYSGIASSFAVQLVFPNGLDNQMILTPAVSASGPLAFRSVRGIIPGILFCPQSILQTIPPGTILDGAGPYLNRKLLALQTYSGGSGGATNVGTIFFDVTGPWRT